MNKQPAKLVSHGSAIALGSLEVARLLAIHGVCPATSLVAILDVVCRGGWSVRFHPFPELLPVGAGYELLEDPSAVLVMGLRELYQESAFPPLRHSGSYHRVNREHGVPEDHRGISVREQVFQVGEARERVPTKRRRRDRLIGCLMAPKVIGRASQT